MRKCPKCGGTEFTCTQVQKHRVILDGSGKFIRNDGCITEDPVTGPYVCRGCDTGHWRNWQKNPNTLVLPFRTV